MNVLITGLTGFVGQHLHSALVQLGEHVIYATTRKAREISSTLDSCIVVPVNNLVPLNELPPIDVVIHLAARAHILKDNASNPAREFSTVNVEGTINIAKAALNAGAKQFIFVSSIGAMATLSAQRLHEESSCWPDTDYGRSKLEAEQRLKELTSGTTMATTILRPTLTYGPRNPGNMARLIQIVNQGYPLPFKTIRSQRSLLFVGNLIDAILQCINNPQAYNQTFLVSDGIDISTSELIEQMATALNKKANLFPFSAKTLKLIGKLTGYYDEMSRLTGSLCVDNEKICKTLSWTPPYSFAQGIQKTCDWYLKTEIR